MRIMAGVARYMPSSTVSEEQLVAASDAAGIARVRPQIPQLQVPQQYFERRMFADGVLAMPDGAKIPYWAFEDPIAAPGVKAFPSPVIRLRENETAQIRLEMLKDRSHKSAAAANTPVRVSTFDTNIYQWNPMASGTWLYQSHTNTPRDFEMGLFGLLVVDPAPDAAGRPLAFKNGPSYDQEKFWVLDDVDPSWHGDVMPTSSGGGEAPFIPKYFLVNGVANTQAQHHRDVAITAKQGEKVLIRLLNASYSLVKVSIEHFQGSIISVDGSAIDTTQSPWTSWIPVQPDRPLFMATGSRHDLLIDLDPAKNPAVRGKSYKVVFEYLDLAKRSIRNAGAQDPLYVGRAETTITLA
jgi:FtsP/CotA-like multicopper oxidase with cupredoxin domain